MGLDWLYNPIAPIRDIGKAIGGAISGNDSKSTPPPAPAPLPQPPNQDAIAQDAQDKTNRKRAAISQTVFTDPLGVGGQANIVRKTLTGQ